MANVSFANFDDKYAINVESAPPKKPIATFSSFKMSFTISIFS